MSEVNENINSGKRAGEKGRGVITGHWLREHWENMSNDFISIGDGAEGWNQASVHAKHMLYHWAIPRALENYFFKKTEGWKREEARAQDTDRPWQCERIEVQIKSSWGACKLRKLGQRKSHPAPSQAPGAGLREVSVMTQPSCVESRNRTASDRGKWGRKWCVCAVA